MVNTKFWRVYVPGHVWFNSGGGQLARGVRLLTDREKAQIRHKKRQAISFVNRSLLRLSMIGHNMANRAPIRSRIGITDLWIIK